MFLSRIAFVDTIFPYLWRKQKSEIHVIIFYIVYIGFLQTYNTYTRKRSGALEQCLPDTAEEVPSVTAVQQTPLEFT